MTGVQVVQAIIEIMVSGLTGIATGIGGAISEMVRALFFETIDGSTGLSIFAIMVVTFAAISLAIGLSKRIFEFLTSFGKN